ncbi:MAG: sigma-70 family RNA polymerase sigma factor [Candidatus Acidiferrales bacterium]
MTSDEQLMGHLLQGDQSALKTLYDRHGKLLYAAALQITGDAGSAEELLQDAFFQLWRKASQFDTARGSLVGWLLTITRRRAISHIRRKRNRAPSQLGDDALVLSPITGSAVLEQQIARQLISAVLARLPKAQREAITLAYFDGLTCEEIAVRTQTPVGTVKGRLRSALKTMKANLLEPNPLPSIGSPKCPATLESILITEELLHRPCRQRSLQKEAACLRSLWAAVVRSPEQLIESFLKMATDLCHAGTTGLSLLETNSTGEQVFRWTHLTGKLVKHVGGTTPRNFSPCGVTLDRNSPQLFAYPGRYFQYFNQVEVPIVEGLVIPFHVGGKTEGTIWIVSHDEQSRFDSEDARIMTSLAEFVGCSLHLKSLGLRHGDNVNNLPDEKAAPGRVD